jgi:hypothetical protein
VIEYIKNLWAGVKYPLFRAARIAAAQAAVAGMTALATGVSEAHIDPTAQILLGAALNAVAKSLRDNEANLLGVEKVF